MKLHASVVEKLLYLINTYGGFANEARLKSMIEKMDLTPYERKTTNSQEMVLVLTEEYVKQLQGQARRK